MAEQVWDPPPPNSKDKSQLLASAEAGLAHAHAWADAPRETWPISAHAQNQQFS